MLTSPTPAIRRSVLQDWGAAGLVALLFVALAGLAVPHATGSGYGALTVIVLLGVAGVLGWHARPNHPKAEHLARALEALSSRGSLVIQLAPRSAADIGRAGLSYAAVARSDAGEVLLAHATEPASVLAVARYWQTRLSVPLVAGWGLTKHDIDVLDGKRPFAARIDYAGPSQHGAAGSSVALVCSAIALFALAGSVAVFRQHPAGALSLVLLVVGLALLALFAAAARTDFTRIAAVQDTLEIERFCLRLRVGGIRLPLDEVRLLAVVSPEGKHGRHLLLGSSGGFWAIECPASLDRVVQGPVVPIRLSQSSAASPSGAPQRTERAPRIVSGNRLS